MKLETLKCDECGAIKKESNHWWKLYKLGIANELATLTYGYTIFKIDPHELLAELDICSEGCLIKAEAKIRELMKKEEVKNA